MIRNDNKQTIFKYMVTNKIWVIVIALFCSVLWGSAFPVLKITYSEMGLMSYDYGSKMVLAGIRFFAAGCILLLLVRFGFKESIKLEKKYWAPVVLLGIMQISLQYFFFYNGLANTTGIKGAILQSSSTFFVIILAHFFYENDKVNWQKLVGLLTGFGGIILINSGKDLDLAFKLNGEGFLLIAGFSGALGMILAKRLARDIETFLLTGWQMTIGSLFLFIVGIISVNGNMPVFTSLAKGLLVYSAFLSAVAFSLWYAILKYNKAGEITIYRFMVPVSGSVLSALFISGELLNYSAIGALILVSMGIMVVNYTGRKE